MDIFPKAGKSRQIREPHQPDKLLFVAQLTVGRAHEPADPLR